jgi:GT2 family glycosyltransferase
MFPKVSIIILNWNGKEDTIECLESLKHLTYPNYEIMLVDNGSKDGSLECFRERYPDIEILENENNLGFAEGNNVGIKKLLSRDEDYIMLLNNDTIVEPSFLDELTKVIESDPTIGIVGPKVYYYDEPNKIQTAGIRVSFWRGTATHLKRNEIDTVDDSRIKEVDSICGCALFARSEVFSKIGYLKKDYFAYWEETDWCVRAHRVGYKIVYVPSAKIWHKEGSTSKKRSGFYEFQMTRNMFWFMKQNSTRVQYILFLVYFFVFRFWFLTGIHLIYHKNPTGFVYFLKGIKAGIYI